MYLFMTTGWLWASFTMLLILNCSQAIPPPATADAGAPAVVDGGLGAPLDIDHPPGLAWRSSPDADQFQLAIWRFSHILLRTILVEWRKVTPALLQQENRPIYHDDSDTSFQIWLYPEFVGRYDSQTTAWIGLKIWSDFLHVMPAGTRAVQIPTNIELLDVNVHFGNLSISGGPEPSPTTPKSISAVKRADASANTNVNNDLTRREDQTSTSNNANPAIAESNSTDSDPSNVLQAGWGVPKYLDQNESPRSFYYCLAAFLVRAVLRQVAAAQIATTIVPGTSVSVVDRATGASMQLWYVVTRPASGEGLTWRDIGALLELLIDAIAARGRYSSFDISTSSFSPRETLLRVEFLVPDNVDESTTSGVGEEITRLEEGTGLTLDFSSLLDPSTEHTE